MPSEAEELLERLEREKLRREQARPVTQGSVLQNPESQRSAGDDFVGAGVRQFVSNTLAIPGAIGDVLDAGGAATEASLGGLTNLLGITDSPDSFGDRFGSAFDRRQQFGISTLPRPTAEDLGAGLTAGVKGVGNLLQGARPNFAGEFRENLPLQQAVRERELSTGAGQAGAVAGDVATLLTGRAPVAGAVKAVNLAAVEQRAATMVGRAIQTTARAIQFGSKRSIRAGSEAATLAALNGANPADVGLIAAGVQATGDVLARPVLKTILKRRITAAVMGATMISIMATEIVPGGFQIVEQTLKDRAKEIGILLMLTGTLAGVTGRVPKSFAGPAFAELASAFKTSGLVRLVAGLKADPERVGPVAGQFAMDPDYFGPEARKKLERAFSGNANPAAVIGNLLEDETFRQRFEAIGTPAAKTFRQDQLSADVKADTRDVPFLQTSKIAGALARRLPKGSSLRNTFEKTGAMTFIAELFRDGEAAAKLLPRLGKDALNKALEINLRQIITASRTKGNDSINGERLRQAWSRLPDAVRKAYSPEARKNIEAFIAEAQATPLRAMPAFLAHSLMTDGLLSQRLTKEK